MGQILGTLNTQDINLRMNDQPTFDHQAGFNYERQQRGTYAIPTS